MPSDKQYTDLSATELLMKVLEQFGECEGQKVVVVFADAMGDVHVMGNSMIINSLGLLEVAKAVLLQTQLSAGTSEHEL